MNKNFNFILKKKSIFYFQAFFIIIFFSYFFAPHFFNYSTQSIKENFKINNDINFKNISKISYKAFPTPRLKVSGSNFYLKENILEIKGGELEIILNPSRILNYKKIHFSKIIVKGGSTTVNTKNIIKLLNYFKKNKLKIILKKNNLILAKDGKPLLEINDNTIGITHSKNQQRLRINGIFLNHKISFLLNNQLGNGTNIKIKIPELDIISNIFLAKQDNLSFFNGFVNFEILNNFFQFSFKKKKNLKIKKGFIRNNSINSSFDGEITMKPNFLLNLNFEPTNLNMKILLPIIQQKYFSDDEPKLNLIKKINGSFTFKKMFQGKVVIENGEILFKNFQTRVNNPLFFDARITEFGKKGKIKFNLLTNIEYNRNSTKELKISGFITPFSSSVTFKQISLDKEIFTSKKIKKYEKKFNKEVINNSLSDIFNETKTNNFLKTFVN